MLCAHDCLPCSSPRRTKPRRRLAWIPLFAFTLAAPLGAQQVGGSDAADAAAGGPEEVVEMGAVEVSASRVSASAVEGPQAIENYSSADIDESGAFTVSEFLDTLPPGAEGDEQLVLIDGQPAYLDPAMLALGMIEAIEVSTEGAMPEHGAYARGRVINIRLKKNYRGRELLGRTEVSFAGGGGGRNVRLSGGELHGKLRLMYSLEHNQSSPLWALDRPFSAQQDHRSQGGSDLRLEWGYPAVIQAVDGDLDALSSGAGQTVAAARVPEGAVVTPDARAFAPADPNLGTGAQGQRRFDTAPYRQLSAPSVNTGGSLSLHYTFGPALNVAVSGSHRASSSDRQGPPPVTPASAGAIVPAAYSPFGEEVAVGLVHLGFGPTRERQSGASSQAGLKLNGRLSESWRWNAGYGYQENRSDTAVTDLDDAAFAAALAAVDPAQRFNPFVDARVANAPSELYRTLAIERRRQQVSRAHRMDLRTNGNAFTTPAGPVRLSFQAQASSRRTDRVTTNADRGTDETSHTRRGSYSLSGATDVPLIAREHARPGLRRLEVQLSGDYERENSGGRQQKLGAGLVWAPAKWLSLRARHAVDTDRNAATVELRSNSLTGETFIDPRRGSTSVSDVQVLARNAVATAAEQAQRTQLGATIEPTFLPGFRLSANYAARRRDPLFEDEFQAQDVINNEAAFPDRVVRDAPTAEDLALGQPGRILAVDTTGGDAGAASSRDLNLSLDYRLPELPLGRLHFKVDARHALASRYEIRPGIAYISEGGSRYNPPDWRIRGHVSWSRDGWNATLRGQHTGSITTNIIDDDLPAYTEFDFNVGYRWQQPWWGDFGRGARVMASIDNLFDRAPPFADTLNGYRGGSALGRAISLSLSVPL